MSMTLMTKCEHCGATVEFVSNCMKGIRFLEFDCEGRVRDWLSGSLPLCADCYDELRGWFGLSEKEAERDDGDD